VAEPEGRRGDRVGQGRVDGGIVVTLESILLISFTSALFPDNKMNQG
jgi:hypothetical protein